jgi:aspartate aminotransferase
MPVSKTITKQLENASWIRRMFEEGVRMKRERGADAVFDFSLGNPDVEPPAAVLDALRRVATGSLPGSHGYMPNPGYSEVREAVAKKLRRETGLEFTAEDVFMTVGSAGACNVILKSILDPGDEVIVLMPFFPEYQVLHRQSRRRDGSRRDRCQLSCPMSSASPRPSRRAPAPSF